MLDNLSNSKMEAVKRIRELAGKDFDFIKDILDGELLDDLFKKYDIDSYILRD